MRPNGEIYADPAMIIAHTRSGGTFLATGLSNHPQIFCPRGEPLLRGMEWGEALGDVSDTEILDCITSAALYKIGMCKITYRQVTEKIVEYLRELGAPVLHLVRENYLRVAVSQIITGRVCSGGLDHKAHSFDVLDAPRVNIDPERVLQRCADMDQRVRGMRETLDGLRVLPLTYSQLVGGEGREAQEIKCGDGICDFLGVDRYPMPVQLRRVNRYSLGAMIENWGEVRRAVKKSQWAMFLDGEGS